MKIYFTLSNTNQWNTAKLLSQSGKSTEKYSNAWYSQLPKESVQLMDFERDGTMLEEVSDLIAIERDREYLYSHIYLSEIEQSKSDAKIAELKNWR